MCDVIGRGLDCLHRGDAGGDLLGRPSEVVPLAALVDAHRMHSTARDAQPGGLDAAQPELHELAIAPHRCPDGPRADPLLRTDAAQLLTGERGGVGRHRVVQHHVRGAERRVHRGDPLEVTGEPQLADRVDRPLQVGVLVDDEDERRVGLRSSLEPHPHPHNDAEVGLDEQLVQRGTEAASVGVPRGAVRVGALAGAQQVTVGQHHLEACVQPVVGTVALVGVAGVHGVADERTPGQVRHRRHQVEAALGNGAVQVLPGHPRLDDRVSQLVIDLQHPVEALEAELDSTSTTGGGPAVTKVASLAVRRDGDSPAVRDAHDLLHLRHRARLHDGRGGEGLVARDPEGVLELVDRGSVRAHPLVADSGGQLRDHPGRDRGERRRLQQSLRCCVLSSTLGHGPPLCTDIRVRTPHDLIVPMRACREKRRTPH